MNERLLSDMKKDVMHKPIKELFEVWHAEQGDRLIQARLNDKSYIFLKEQLTEDRSVYVGIRSRELENKISELKELQLLNRHLDAVIENSYDGIYITNRDGVTLRTNSAIERITDSERYYLNKNVDALVKRGILENSVTDKVIKNKRSVSLVQLSYSGKETLLTGNPVFDEQGEVEAVVTNIRDLSDLNDLQTALRKANELNKSYQEEIEGLKGSGPFIDGKTVVKTNRCNPSMTQLSELRMCQLRS